ncbi:hypothetical protein [Halorussus salinus]|uniref:hypothetical protein n=1 Tax=Halorussus salinus TaxID=1364935 RepID=UPI0010926B8E|nr:hypothetical protein [Halorussus salinus]
MTTQSIDQLRMRLDETGARTALVRGAAAPPRPPETVAVAPGVSRAVGVDDGPGPLFVTGETAEGRTAREFDGRNPRAAADRAAGLLGEHDSRAAWLCGRDQIRAWWGRGTAAMLERRLAEAARDADARLVVWTNDYEPTRSDREPTRSDRECTNDDCGTTDEECVTVEDRYDVVLDP